MKKKVIQFNENHKWCGCFGFVHRMKSKNIYMIAVPIPQQGTAFIFAENKDFDIIGETDLYLSEEED